MVPIASTAFFRLMKTFAGLPNFKYRPQYARAVDIFEIDRVAAVFLQRDRAEEGAAKDRKPKARFVQVRATVGPSRAADASTAAAAVAGSLP